MTKGHKMAEILFISLIHLIQHPDVYDQKHVRMIGYASLKFEGKAIYVSREDYQNAITKNAIWLDVELTEAIRKHHQMYVLVEGVFDKDSLGHLRLYSGTLKNVNRLERWQNGDQPKK
jgi:hypothetical protein